jgi:hypothetical protein
MTFKANKIKEKKMSNFLLTLSPQTHQKIKTHAALANLSMQKIITTILNELTEGDLKKRFPKK